MMRTTSNWLENGLEILNPENQELSSEAIENMRKLCEKLQNIQDVYGHQLVCNSGYRSPEEQMRINPKAPNSWHTKGAAVDLSDVDGKLWEFVCKPLTWGMPSIEKLIEIKKGQRECHYDFFDIYLEDRNATPTWVHIQIYPPKSWHRVFKP